MCSRAIVVDSELGGALAAVCPNDAIIVVFEAKRRGVDRVIMSVILPWLRFRITGNWKWAAVITSNYSCNYRPVITGPNYR